jgi:Family of unknown function (DUF6518)
MIRTERHSLVIAVLVGVGLGTFSLLADGVIGGRLFGILGNMAAPWALGAFFVGHRATSLRRGALLGALTLVVGVAVYYVSGAVRGYVVGAPTLVWTLTALLAGPTMGLCGAAVAARPARPPLAAVVAPSALLVAEAIFLVVDRRPWHWNLGAEPYRLIDLAVAVVLFLGGFSLALFLAKEARGRATILAAVAVVGAIGAVALAGVRELITSAV